MALIILSRLITLHDGTLDALDFARQAVELI